MTIVEELAPRVLIVDDDPGVRDVLRVGLEATGYRVASAANGKEALAEIERERPAALVCDVRMPVMDGLELLEALRGNAATRDLPVLMLTSADSDADIVRGVGGGASMYLTKPVQISRLIPLLQGIAPLR